MLKRANFPDIGVCVIIIHLHMDYTSKCLTLKKNSNDSVEELLGFICWRREEREGREGRCRKAGSQGLGVGPECANLISCHSLHVRRGREDIPR